MAIPPIGAAAATEVAAASKIALNVETTGVASMTTATDALKDLGETLTRTGWAGYYLGQKLGDQFNKLNLITRKQTKDLEVLIKEEEVYQKMKKDGDDVAKRIAEQELDRIGKQKTAIEGQIKAVEGLWKGYVTAAAAIGTAGVFILKNFEHQSMMLGEFSRLSGQAITSTKEFYRAQEEGLSTIGSEGIERAKDIYTTLLKMRQTGPGGVVPGGTIGMIAGLTESINPNIVGQLPRALVEQGRSVKEQLSLLYQLDIAEDALGLTQGSLSDGVLQIVNNLRLFGITTDDVLRTLDPYLKVLKDGSVAGFSLNDALQATSNTLRDQKNLNLEGGGLVGMLEVFSRSGKSLPKEVQEALDVAAKKANPSVGSYQGLGAFEKPAALRMMDPVMLNRMRWDLFKEVAPQFNLKNVMEAPGSVLASRISQFPLLKGFGVGETPVELEASREAYKRTVTGGPSLMPFTQKESNNMAELYMSLTMQGKKTQEQISKMSNKDMEGWAKKEGIELGQNSTKMVEFIKMEATSAAKGTGLASDILNWTKQLDQHLQTATAGILNLPDTLSTLAMLSVMGLQLIQLHIIAAKMGAGSMLPGPMKWGGTPLTGWKGKATSIGRIGGALGAVEGFGDLALGERDTGSMIGAGMRGLGGVGMMIPSPWTMGIGAALYGGGAALDYFSSGKSKASGGAVSSGMYRMHDQEFVVPASGLSIVGGRAQAMLPGGGGSPTTVNITLTLPGGMSKTESFEIIDKTFGDTNWTREFADKTSLIVRASHDRAAKK